MYITLFFFHQQFSNSKERYTRVLISFSQQQGAKCECAAKGGGREGKEREKSRGRLPFVAIQFQTGLKSFLVKNTKQDKIRNRRQWKYPWRKPNTTSQESGTLDDSGSFVLLINRLTYWMRLFLKTHFQPWCHARRDPISCNTKFPDHWKPSKIVFLKSHPGHIVNCFTVNTFAVRHFTVSLQYFEFCPEESEENSLGFTLGSLRTLCTRSAKRTTLEFFHFLEALEDCKWKYNIFQRKIGIFQREIWGYLRTVSRRVIEKLSVKRLNGFVPCKQG